MGLTLSVRRPKLRENIWRTPEGCDGVRKLSQKAILKLGKQPHRNKVRERWDTKSCLILEMASSPSHYIPCTRKAQFPGELLVMARPYTREVLTGMSVWSAIERLFAKSKLSEIVTILNWALNLGAWLSILKTERTMERCQAKEWCINTCIFKANKWWVAKTRGLFPFIEPMV